QDQPDDGATGHISTLNDDRIPRRRHPERRSTIAGCLQLRAVFDDDVSVGLLDRALAFGGVQRFEPLGERFDPACHQVTGTVAAPDATADGTVAHTSMAGYLDAGQLLLPADVVVYKTPTD
ncbi:MAG: nucleotide exchange factor GrpE, partial [Mycolicibacterium sp.]|uniref:nucleotide exchange factor GrpE n=1 Tax=Mycolicibacterium sp. TaxID=2320850 RepID=UPI000FA87BD9